jgi:hypothetical protein
MQIRVPIPNQRALLRILRTKFFINKIKNNITGGRLKIAIMIRNPYKKSVKSIAKEAVIATTSIKPAEYSIINKNDNGLFMFTPFMPVCKLCLQLY